jgi:glycosyltransferase involved in cell wall biosynthesis
MSGRDPSRIVLISGNSLCHNPRVLKAATTLKRHGYDVHVLGAWLEADLKTRDQAMLAQASFRFEPVFDATLPGFENIAAHTLRRARRKVANAMYGLTGWQSRDQLGYSVGRLLARAQALKANLYIAHSEPALYVAWRLMQDGRRAGVDMEDWYSEDLPVDVRAQRPLDLLRRLESELLVKGACATCPSRAMSEALAAAYGGKPPAVVYNAFQAAERAAVDGLRKDRRDGTVPSIYWFSQTLGPGRGLEDLIAALPFLDRDVEIHLRGRAAPGMAEWIRSQVPARWRARLFLHPPAPNEELLSRLAEHDIGFAGEQPYCRSRELTVTNKILHCLLGGLAVVASDTAGQREVAMQASGAVTLYEPGNPAALAQALRTLIDSPDALARAKAAALQAAERVFCWERQEQVLLRTMQETLRDLRPVPRSPFMSDTKSGPARRVLLVTSSYAPTMIADMQRARQLAWQLPEAGWQVEILCPGIGYQPPVCNDADSAEFFSPAAKVHAVPPRAAAFFRFLGIGSIGLRALAPMYFAGGKLLAARRFDLVYFSTAQFPLFLLGPPWRRRFKIPYVLDLHDPIFTGAAAPGGWKRRPGRWFARLIERRAAASASGLIAVSPHYLELMRSRYADRRPPWLKPERQAVIPFAVLPRDLQAAGAGSAETAGGVRRIVYVGTGGAVMARSFRVLCKCLAELRRLQPQVLENIRIELYGTSSAVAADMDAHLARIAGECDVAELVGEYPARVTYRHSLELLRQSDGALVLGVDDAGYMPSKLATYAYSGKPLLACLHRDGPALAMLRAQPALGHALWFSQTQDMPLADAAAVVAAYLEEVRSCRSFARQAELAPHTAATMAARHAQLFETCLDDR